MLALTLWQPWAWAILHLPLGLAKPVENRDWMPPRGVIGTRIALHGGKRYDAAARHSIAGANMDAYILLPSDARRFYGGILGTVRLVGVVEERRGYIELVAGGWGEVTRERCAPWFVGRYGWLFDQRRVLDTPIPCRGFQKLWTVPDDVAARVEG
jgi:hypothetical protein